MAGLSVLLVGLVAGLVGYAVLMEAPSARPGGRYVVEVPPGETVVYSVLPQTLEVVLVSAALARRDVPPDARQSQDIALDVAWVAPSGEVRREERLWERTRVTAWPVRGGSWRPSSLLRDDGSWATDTRNTLLPVGEVLPAGGELHITVPLDSPPLLFRAYGARAQEVAASDRKEEERARIARRVGVEALGALEADERGLALGRPRRSLAYRLASGRNPELRRLIRAQAPLAMTEQPVAGSTLLPGQGVAVHLDGPVSVRLSVPEGLSELVVDAVVDLPDEVSQPTLVPEPAPPLPVAGGREGARLRLDAPHTTLRMVNRSDRTLGPVVFAVETRDPDVLAAETPGMPLARLAPWSDAPLTLVGPDRVTVPAVHVGPDSPEPLLLDVPLGSPPIRLTARPLLVRPDQAPARVPVRVLFQDLRGSLLDVVDLAVPVLPAPFERRVSDGGWVGEAVPFLLELPEGTARLEVGAPQAPVRLSAAVEGPPRGLPSDTLYPGWSLRYRRQALLPWHWLPPANADALREARQLRAILANVRLEKLEPDPLAETRRYAILDPLPQAIGLERTWLLPGAYPDGRAWCRLPEGPTQAAPWDRQAVVDREGELHAILHTPAAMALGAPWRLLVDGRIVASGLLNQRIEPIRVVGLDPAARMRLEAPGGSVAWVRAVEGPGCPAPQRGVSAWPMEGQEPLDFALETSGPGHRLYLGGFAEAPVTFEVTLTGLAPTPEDAQAGTWTERVRLRPGEVLAQRLRDPDGRMPALEAVGFQLGATVDEVGLTVRQVEGPPAWLRVLTEVDAAVEGSGRDAVLLRRRP